MDRLRLRARLAVAVLSTAWVASACIPGDTVGRGGDAGSSDYSPDRTLPPPAHREGLPCGNPDPSQLCIALRYVAYKNDSGLAAVSRTQASALMGALNSVWGQCQVQFHLESYEAVDPGSRGLAYSPTTLGELGNVRGSFAGADALLITTTGPWGGELGAQAANAWTVLPPIGPFGVVLESPAAHSAGLIAHEIGHYLNLDHVSDPFDVMNPTVFANSLNLTDDQCDEARATAISFWGGTLR